jgi:ferric-dicitrate binding protein FerR (iron transport regulator)
MKSLDRQSLDEQMRLVSRYVAGDLSRSERADFEAWLVASPELAAEVEMERRMRRGIASAARRGWLKRGTQTVPSNSDGRWRMAMAASVVIALVTLGISVLLPAQKQEQSGGRIAASSRHLGAARTVRLSSMRGLGTTPDVTITRADSPSQLTIEPHVVVLTCEDGSIELECPGGSAPQTPQYGEYEMELVNRQGSTMTWRSTRQTAIAGSSQLSFTIPDPGSLERGDYDLIVRGHSPDNEEVVARFWLRIS